MYRDGAPKIEQPPPMPVGSIEASAQDFTVRVVGADIEDFRRKEPLGKRIGRYATNAGNVLRSGYVIPPPHKYDLDGYEEQVGIAVDGLTEPGGLMAEETYKHAGRARGYLNLRSKQYFGLYEFSHNDPRGVQNIGILRAITHHPSFITNTEQAAAILKGLGSEVSSSVAYDLFTHYDKQADKRVLNDGLSVDSLPHLEALADNDGMWEVARDPMNTRDTALAERSLESLADAFTILSQTNPDETFGARFKMLVRNAANGASKSRKIDDKLVASFKAGEQRSMVREIVENPDTPEFEKMIAQKILFGR